MQCGVTPITPARPGKVHELWEDWSQRPLENGRRRHSQVGWGGGWVRDGRRRGGKSGLWVGPGLPGSNQVLRSAGSWLECLRGN